MAKNKIAKPMKSSKLGCLKQITGRKMRPDLHLVNTLEFRMAVFLPLTSSLVLGLLSSWGQELQLSISPEGMENFLKLFKLPLGLASLAIPIAAVVAANHRSMQTAQQIKEQNSQNIFSNHLEHRKYFFQFIEDHNPFKGLPISTSKLYDSLFKNAVEGELSPNLPVIKTIIIETNYLNKEILKLLKLARDEKLILQDNSNIVDLILDYYFNMGLFFSNGIETTSRFDAKTPIENLQTVVENSSRIFSGTISCSKFHRNYNYEEDFDLEDIEILIDVNNEILKKVIPQHRLYNEIKYSLKNYVEGYRYRENEPTQGELDLRDRLQRIDRESPGMFSNQEEYLEFVEIIIKSYLTIDQQKLLMKTSPSSWKDLFPDLNSDLE